eukprot:c47214_g1_i1.p1 GENE.c47214_g1_i1~~c47214_g1_i1.p1  ORF type:complete len:369 (+),score=57.13 c47214_g1_i1:121-1227(+)
MATMEALTQLRSLELARQERMAMYEQQLRDARANLAAMTGPSSTEAIKVKTDAAMARADTAAAVTPLKLQLIQAQSEIQSLEDELKRSLDVAASLEDRLKTERDAQKKEESACAFCNRMFLPHETMTHQISCDWQEVDCRVCQQSFRRSRLQAHMEACHRCSECGLMLSSLHVVRHIMTDCPATFSPCPICNERVHFSAVDSHRMDCTQSAARQALLSIEPVLGVVLLQELSSQAGEGIEVDKVRPNTAASMAGLRRGDRILEVEGMKTDTHAQFNVVLENAFPGEENVFMVQRGKTTVPVRVRYGGTSGSVDDIQALRALAGSDWCTIMDAKAVHDRRAHVRQVSIQREGHIERILANSPVAPSRRG